MPIGHLLARLNPVTENALCWCGHRVKDHGRLTSQCFHPLWVGSDEPRCPCPEPSPLGSTVHAWRTVRYPDRI